MAQTHIKVGKRGLFAWALYDWAHNAFGTIIITFIFAPYFSRMVAPDQTTGTALWGNAVGIAVFIAAVLAPVLGAAADQKGHLKLWLGGATYLCAAAAAGLWFITPDSAVIYPALILVGIGIVGAQLSQVFYNTMLATVTSPEKRRKWSGWGWGLGYIGGLACLCVIWVGWLGTNPILDLPMENGLPVRLACLFTALWLIVFSVPLFIWTPDVETGPGTVFHAISKGLGQLKDTLKHSRKYKHIIRFLIAHMLYRDGLSAVFAMGGVFAAGAAGMSTQQVLLFGITLNVTAGLGALGFAWVDHHLGSKSTIMIGLIGLILSALAMVLTTGILTAFWSAGLVFGIFVGPVQAASRSYLAHAAPADLRTQMFGLYALSGKATSFIGPLMVGGITALTGSQILGMSSLLLLFISGFLLILTVPRALLAEKNL